MKKTLVILLIALVAVSLFVGCKKEPKVQTYTVTFDSTDASEVKAQKVVKGEKATLPENPTHTGWGLLMWSKTEDGTEAFSFDTAITEDITLYAVWQKTYTVGDEGPGGGVLVYDVDADNESGNADKLKSSECGWRFLECSKKYVEGYEFSTKTGSFGTKTGLGEGKTNTEKKLVGEEFKAARMCANYSKKNESGIVYDDWFLPSWDELTKVIYSGKVTLDRSSAQYMSSSENGSGYQMYYITGDSVYSNTNDYTDESLVFPVRRF